MASDWCDPLLIALHVHAAVKKGIYPNMYISAFANEVAGNRVQIACKHTSVAGKGEELAGKEWRVETGLHRKVIILKESLPKT